MNIGGHITKEQFLSIYKTIPKNTEVIGLVKNIVQFINSVDLLIVPITTTHFCRPVIEAAALGKPAILPDLEGMDEMIEAGKTGFIFKAADSKDLAKKINYAATHRMVLHEMGTKARNKYEQDFARSINVAKVIDVFEELLK